MRTVLCPSAVFSFSSFSSAAVAEQVLALAG